MSQEHLCIGDVPSNRYSWWARDGRGYELCRVCERCEREKLSRYRPEILAHYNEFDVDEALEE